MSQVVLDTFTAVRSILMSSWDPIGVRDIPEAFDEYDSYAWDITHMLGKKASASEIFNYLAWAVVRMGLENEYSVNQCVAESLFLSVNCHK
jgi:hypothetical protein